ncbi:phage baseplate upper protein [Enterococcus faecium]|nr:phage baseplate upper protein [Enterococcus faecium]
MTITGFTFKSYDKKAGVLQFEIKNQDGSPTDLIDATVRLFMYIYQGEEKKEFPIFDNQIITESYMQGIVKYRIPDMLLSYEGKVDANVYIDFPDGSHTDNLAFTFNIEKSVIDDNVQLNGEYYFKDFQQLLDGVKQEATDAVNEALAKVEVVSENVSSAQNDLTILEDRIDQTNQQISNLGKLKKMYSNSIDFGGYDYSGNPNLLPSIDFSKLSASSSLLGTPPKYVKDYGQYFELDGSDPDNLDKAKNVFIPLLTRLTKGKTYTIRVGMMIDDNFILGNAAFYYTVWTGKPTATSDRLVNVTPDEGSRNAWKVYTKTFTVPSDQKDGDTAPFLQLYFPPLQKGKIKIGYDIKIEEGSTATPYQPNLLDAPYYLSKMALGENIANKTINYPIKTSSYVAYTASNIENYQANQTYTVTMKATKPATQTFGVYIKGGTLGVGNMIPVEGKTDEWSLSFTVTQAHINAGVTHDLSIYQLPQATVGACQIDWLKIEKGDTRTPNISEYKYFGEGLKDSNNPNDYSWDVTPEYTEKGLNDTVSLTEPQSVEGLKNFEDGLQVRGKEVATVPEDTGWVNLTAINGHSWNKQGQIRRIGKLVMFRGSLKGSTLSTQDFCTIPEGFRPSNPTDDYEYQFLLPPQSSNTLDNGGMAYIRPNGVCGLPSFRGTVNLFLAPIQYYID